MEIYSPLEDQDWDGYETLNGIKERILEQLRLEKMNVSKGLLDFNKYDDLMKYLKENYVTNSRAELMGYKWVIKRIELPKIKWGSKWWEVINCFVSEEPVRRDVFEGNPELVEQSISSKDLRHSLQTLRRFMKSLGYSHDDYVDDYIKYLRDELLQYKMCEAWEVLKYLLWLHDKYWTHDRGKWHFRGEKGWHEILYCLDSDSSEIPWYFFLQDGCPNSEDLAYLLLVVREQSQDVSKGQNQVIWEKHKEAVQAIREQSQDVSEGCKSYEYDKLEALYGKNILENIQWNKDMIIEYMKKNCVKIENSRELWYDWQEVKITLPSIKWFKWETFEFFISKNKVRRAKLESYSYKLSTYNYIWKLFVYMYGFMQELEGVKEKRDLNYEHDFCYSRGGSKLVEPRCASMWEVLKYIVGIGEKDKFRFTKPKEIWNVYLAGWGLFTYFFPAPYGEIAKKWHLFIPLR